MKMMEFYASDNVNAMRKKAKACFAWGWSALLIALIVCIFLCTRVRYGNADTLLLIVIGVFTLAGWIFLYLTQVVGKPARAEANHAESILRDAPGEYREGILQVEPMVLCLPGSIAARKITLKNADETVSLCLDEWFADKMPANGTFVRVLVIRGYVAGIEVCDA